MGRLRLTLRRVLCKSLNSLSDLIFGGLKIIVLHGDLKSPVGTGILASHPSGLLARIALSPPSREAFRMPSPLAVDASLEPVTFDLSSWLTLFDRLWPAGSDAALSYRHRILNGTGLTVEQLLGAPGKDKHIL